MAAAEQGCSLGSAVTLSGCLATARGRGVGKPAAAWPTFSGEERGREPAIWLSLQETRVGSWQESGQ